MLSCRCVLLIAHSSQRLALLLRLPQPEPALARMGVISGECAWRQRSEPFGVPSAQHDVIGLQSSLQLSDHVKYRLDPLLFPHPLQGSRSHVILERFAMLVGKV